MSPQVDSPPGPCHLYAFNPNPKTITWERLEADRLLKLGLSNKYSRHFNVLRTKNGPHDMMMVSKSADVARSFDLSGSSAGIAQAVENVREADVKKSTKPSGKTPAIKANSLAPFATLGKPTCGFFFSDRTDNRKRNFGIPPSDLVKWRNFSASN